MFENSVRRTRETGYFLLSVQITDYNIMIDGRNIFEVPVKNNMRTYENIRKIAIDQGDDYATGCLLNYLDRFIII